MKIGILTNTYPPNVNGVSHSVKNLVDALWERGIEVFVATPKVEGVKYPDYVLPLKSFSAPKSISLDLQIPFLYTKEVTDFFRKNRVQLIHTHDTIFGGLEGAQIAKKLRIPCVHTYHTLIESYNYFDIPGYKPVIRKISQHVCNQYDLVISLSSKIEDYLQEIEVHTPRKNLLNIYNFEELGTRPYDHGFAEMFGIQETDFVFLTFCRIAEEKGLDVGIQTLASLMKKYSNIKYVIAGFGPDLERLQSLAQQFGVQDQVIFSGKYVPSEIPKLASIAQAFLFTSTTDNLPTNVLEAASCGLPVISIDDSSVDFVLDHGVNGEKVSVSKLPEACEKIYLQKELRDEYAKNSLLQIAQMKARDITGEYIDVYKELIGKQRLLSKKTNVRFNRFLKLKRTFSKAYRTNKYFSF
jgi:1,2-diacylglycerol 3-alpha-glucosyltransferase